MKELDRDNTLIYGVIKNISIPKSTVISEHSDYQESVVVALGMEKSESDDEEVAPLKTDELAATKKQDLTNNN